MADLAISIVLVPTLLAFVPKRTTAPPQERWLMAPMRLVARHHLAPARAGAGDRGGAGAGLGRRHPAPPRRHQPHQLLLGPASAVAVGPADRRQAVRRLRFPGVLRGAGRVDPRAGGAGQDRCPGQGDRPAAQRPQRDFARRLRQADRSRSRRHRRRHGAGVIGPDRPGAVRVRAVGRRAARAVADRRQRLLARPDDRADGVDELGRPVPAGAAGAGGGRPHLRRLRRDADRHGIGAALRPARSLPGVVAGHQLLHCFRHRIRGDLRRSSGRSASAPWPSRPTCSPSSSCSVSWAGAVSR